MENGKKQGTVMTLDAGGTNFVFSAIRDGKFVVEPLRLDALANDLDKCLGQMVKGFSEVKRRLDAEPVAISFAFPGPADYPRGIIGGFMPNFPSFRNGVALGAFLEEKFGIPVFINNDADLYAYGEALEGKLPEINEKLRKCGSSKQYKNLLGYTFGTGFGFGFVSDGRLHIGDNSCVETFCLPNKFNSDIIAEEGVSARALKNVYVELTGDTTCASEPKDLFEIAEGIKEGDAAAAKESFSRFGEAAGDSIAMALSMIDGIVVLGGGITAAHKYFMPALLAELRSSIHTAKGEAVRRVQMNVYDLDDEEEFKKFAAGESRMLKVPGSEREVEYDPEKRVGIAISKLGASKAISIGAATYALREIGK
jgi:glucokinase